VAIQKCSENQGTGLLRCARNDAGLGLFTDPMNSSKFSLLQDIRRSERLAAQVDRAPPC